MRTSILSLLALVVLAACSGAETAAPSAPAVTIPEASTASPAGGEPTAEPAAPSVTEAPPPAPPPNDTYDVDGAGTVTVEPDRPTVLVDAVPAEGWTLEETEQGDDELEVRFRRGEERVELEVADDYGGVEVKVCRESPVTDNVVHTDGGVVAVAPDDDDDWRLLDATPDPGWEVRTDDDDVRFTDGTRTITVETDDDEMEVCERLRR